MAFTITSNLLNGEISGSSKFTAGQVMNWVFTLQYTGSLFGKKIAFNPALFIDLIASKVNAVEFPQDAWHVQLPAGIGSGTMAFTSNLFCLQQKNYECTFTLTAGNTITITLSFLLTQDLGNFIETGAFADSTDRFQKNSINADLRDTNNISSVYNYKDGKLMRGHVILGDAATNSILDQAFVDYELYARWYDRGLFDGTPEYFGWSYEFERNSVIVNNLSVYENTLLRVYVDTATAGAIDTATQLNVYRTDGSSGLPDYVNDIRFGAHANAVLLVGTDYVIAHTTWALVAGTVYAAEWTIDASKLENGAQYRFGVVIKRAAGTYYNSYQTKTVPTNAIPKVSAGLMSGLLLDYNDIYTGNCLRATLNERVRSSVEVDKASYLVDLAAISAPGDFDANLRNVQVRVYSAFQIGGQTVELFNQNTATNDGSLEIIDTPTTYRSEAEFRMLDIYPNSLWFIDHIYTYDIAYPNNPYTDVVTFRQVVNVGELDEVAATPLLTNMELFDGNGDPLVEICELTALPIKCTVTKAVTVSDYNLISVIRKEDLARDWGEQEDYTYYILEQQNTPEIGAVDVLFVANQADIELSISELEIDTSYRLFAVAKPVNLAPPVLCSVINLQTQTLVTAVVPVGSDVVVSFTNSFLVTNYAPALVATVDINTSTDPKGAGVAQTNNFILDAGSYAYTVTWVGGFTANPITILMDVTVTLNNGCTYQFTFLHYVYPLLANITALNEDLIAL